MVKTKSGWVPVLSLAVASRALLAEAMVRMIVTRKAFDKGEQERQSAKEKPTKKKEKTKMKSSRCVLLPI